jgi:hypothetical protein
MLVKTAKRLWRRVVGHDMRIRLSTLLLSGYAKKKYSCERCGKQEYRKVWPDVPWNYAQTQGDQPASR